MYIYIPNTIVNSYIQLQNIRVIAKYYGRVHMSRVAQLLDLDVNVRCARHCHLYIFPLFFVLLFSMIELTVGFYSLPRSTLAILLRINLSTLASIVQRTSFHSSHQRRQGRWNLSTCFCPDFSKMTYSLHCFQNNTSDLLNEWTSSTEQLLRLVEQTSHLIAKERMQHQVEESPASWRKRVKSIILFRLENGNEIKQIMIKNLLFSFINI